MEEIIVDVWGDFACFSRAEAKVERMTYPVPTPSAMRGVLSAIYSKPNEFYWQVTRIEVLHKLSYASFKLNEVKEKLPEKPKEAIQVDLAGGGGKGRTQRQTVALKNVRYRVHAKICKRPGFAGTEQQLYAQALRRIRAGQCFYQPSLGLRPFAAYFEEGVQPVEPIALDLDLGWMLYDTFDLHRWQVTAKAEPFVTLFHAQLKNGILEVPDFDSPQVLRPEVNELAAGIV